jgi:hypothetical protein
VSIASHHDEPTDDPGATLIQMADYVAYAAGFAGGVRPSDPAPTLPSPIAEKVGQSNIETLINELQDKHSDVREMVSLLTPAP